ncbi:MAG: recombinase family protein [PVC group bacterium]|nr:recombinase family protein [PVC group bacterium]
MKVAIYVRVSKNDQTTENQAIPLIRYATAMGWDYDIVSETESTRKTRPKQWELYNKLLKKEYDGLLIYKFDRWARSTKELIEHVERLLNKGISIYSYSENIDLSSSMGRAMLTIISAFAQLERDLISERTKAGLERAKARGKVLGRPRLKRTYKARKVYKCLKCKGDTTNPYVCDTCKKELKEKEIKGCL